MFPDYSDYCSRFFGYNLSLDSNLYPIAFGIENHTFIIPVAGGSGRPYHLDSIVGHLLGEAVYLFF